MKKKNLSISGMVPKILFLLESDENLGKYQISNWSNQARHQTNVAYDRIL
jgi:hypothetical protein